MSLKLGDQEGTLWSIEETLENQKIEQYIMLFGV